MKADLKTKLIIKAATTPAHVHDSQVFEELLDDKYQAVLADSAYHSAEHEEHLIKLNAQEFLMRKATRGHALSEKEQQTNHTISRMRVRVEHIFARMAQMGTAWCRSIGLKRAKQHNTPEQLGLQHGPLCLLGSLSRAERHQTFKRGQNEPETTLNRPTKRTPPPSHAKKGWQKR